MKHKYLFRALCALLAALMVTVSAAGCTNSAATALVSYIGDIAGMSAAHYDFTVSLGAASDDAMSLLPADAALQVDARISSDSKGLQYADVNLYLKNSSPDKTFLTEVLWTGGSLYIKLTDALRATLTSTLQSYLGMQPGQAYIGADLLKTHDWLQIDPADLGGLLAASGVGALLSGDVSSLLGDSLSSALGSVDTSSSISDAIDSAAAGALGVPVIGAIADSLSAMIKDVIANLQGDPFADTGALTQDGSTVTFNLTPDSIPKLTASLINFASQNLDMIQTKVEDFVAANHDALQQEFAVAIQSAYNQMIASGQITADQVDQQAIADNVTQTFAELSDQIGNFFANLAASLASAGDYMAANPDYNILTDLGVGVDSLSFSVGRTSTGYSFGTSLTAAGDTDPAFTLDGTVDKIAPFTLAAPDNAYGFTQLQSDIRQAVIASPDQGAYLVVIDFDYAQVYTLTKSGVTFSDSLGPVVTGPVDADDPDSAYILPARAVFELFGETVGWDADTGTAYLLRDGKQVAIPGQNIGGKWIMQPSTLARLGYSYVADTTYSFMYYIYRTDETFPDLQTWLPG